MGTLLITLLIFAVMITIHEFGHFAVARLCGVRINEFSIGMGPQILQKQGAETKYTLRALPIGGYVSMEGEDENSTDARAFCNKVPWKRFLIVAAGAIMNLLLGFVILFCVNIQVDTLASNSIAQFQEESMSDQTGLQVGDEILKINGVTIFTDTDIVSEILGSSTATMVFEVKRDGEVVRLPEVTFITQEGEDGAADQLYIDFYVQGIDNNPWQTAIYAVKLECSLGRMIWSSLVDLITGEVGFDQLSGPVGVGEAVGEATSYGLSSLMVLCAFLTVNLGIFNLLPLPALDGGRLVFILIEMIFRKPIPQKYERWVHGIGIMLLLGLMLAITLKDIYQLF